MTPNTKRINLKVPSYTHAWLKQKASECSLTMTELINRILAHHIAEQEKINAPEQF